MSKREQCEGCSRSITIGDWCAGGGLCPECVDLDEMESDAFDRVLLDTVERDRIVRDAVRHGGRENAIKAQFPRLWK